MSPKRPIALLIVLILAVLISACSAPRAAATQSPAMDSNKGMEGRNYEEPAAAPAEPQEMGNGAPSAGSGGEGAAPRRIVIKNASLSIAVPDPIVSLEAITKMAEDMGGFVVSSNTYKRTLSDGTEVPEADVTIRVPAERMNEAMDQIKAQVTDREKNVLTENVSGQDVTKEYTDLKSRLKNLQQAEEELRRIMDEAVRAEDVLSTFNQLTYVREQIEVIQGQINYYEEAASLSAISVEIKAEASVQPLTVAGWEPVGVARDAVQALIDTMQFLVNALIWIILYVLPVFLVIFIPLRILWVFLRRSRKPRQPQPVPPANPGD